MSRRSSMRMAPPPSAAPGSGSPYALDDRLSRRRADRARRARRPRGRHPRPRRPSLLRHAARRDRPLLRARLSRAPRSSPISAASRSASPSTATATSISCVGAMGLYRIAPDGDGHAALRRDLALADLDPRRRAAARSQRLDIAPTAGSTSPIRPSATTRMTGRSTRSRTAPPAACSVYDPTTGRTATLLDGYRYANGVCMAHDGHSLFFAESWACRIHRYWLEGPEGRHGRMPSSATCRAIPTTSTAPPTAATGWPGSACARRLRPGAAPSRHAQAHDPPPAAGRMAVPQHQHRRRGEIRRERPRSSRPCGDLTGTAIRWSPRCASTRAISIVGGILNNRIGRLNCPAQTPSGRGRAPIGARRRGQRRGGRHALGSLPAKRGGTTA